MPPSSPHLYTPARAGGRKAVGGREERRGGTLPSCKLRPSRGWIAMMGRRSSDSTPTRGHDKARANRPAPQRPRRARDSAGKEQEANAQTEHNGNGRGRVSCCPCFSRPHGFESVSVSDGFSPLKGGADQPPWLSTKSRKFIGRLVPCLARFFAAVLFAWALVFLSYLAVEEEELPLATDTSLASIIPAPPPPLPPLPRAPPEPATELARGVPQQSSRGEMALDALTSLWGAVSAAVSQNLSAWSLSKNLAALERRTGQGGPAFKALAFGLGLGVVLLIELMRRACRWLRAHAAAGGEADEGAEELSEESLSVASLERASAGAEEDAVADCEDALDDDAASLAWSELMPLTPKASPRSTASNGPSFQGGWTGK